LLSPQTQRSRLPAPLDKTKPSSSQAKAQTEGEPTLKKAKTNIRAIKNKKPDKNHKKKLK